MSLPVLARQAFLLFLEPVLSDAHLDNLVQCTVQDLVHRKYSLQRPHSSDFATTGSSAKETDSRTIADGHPSD